MLPTPGFHHLHLNSVDPEAAIDFYTRRFATTSRTSWGDMPALHSPTNVLILFTKVDVPPKTSPQTAILALWLACPRFASDDGEIQGRARRNAVTALHGR